MINRKNIVSAATAVLLASCLSAQVITTNTGTPVGDNQSSKTAGVNGPTLLEDIHLIEKLAAFDRERIPERVVHARGAGAFGEFIAANDFSDITSAEFLSKGGKATPVMVRFSTVIHQQGSPETYRDPRGFSVKFYTEQGNYDLVGNNLPVFFIRDAMKFPDMVNAFKPSPVTNKASDPNRVFDFFAQIPEGTHMLTWVFSNYGIPANYREMQGNGVHAFKWVNEKKEVTYVKYKWVSKQGERNLTQDQADSIQSKNIEHATADLYTAIEEGNYPKWDLYVQMLKENEFEQLNFNPLDATKIWPEDKIPPVLVGTMTLNANPTNYFQQVEQSAFSPGTLVPGIEPSEDKLLQGRLFSYFDTQRHRIGGNFQQLPVNASKAPVKTYNQNGYMSTREQEGEVNYQPANSQPSVADNSKFKYSQKPLGNASTTQQKIPVTDDFTQAGALYRSFSSEDQDHLIKNLSDALRDVKDPKVVAIMISYFYRADRDYGMRLAQALNLSRESLEKHLQ
ncbi:catalase [Sphingobacterium sp. lm-10]|uniref:catalase n=1 Tax=Sphingobacterium sp. lm-10 TaxID=2944904 RepID=UPI002020C95F|nr:catalase [Sphingobacterium sp. lm-10]MCL7987324.1 catalase [Sphingobacterium sp. lm-10]